MYYWNQNNFEGLKQIAEHFKDDSELKLFAEYCQYREQGLRKIAMQKIHAFITECKQYTFEKQKSISQFMVELLFKHSRIHSLSSAPLHQYLLHVFQEWKEIEPKNVIIYQWIGFLTHDIEMYKQGYALNSNNQICLKALIENALTEVEWQTHHIHESLFIGELDDAYKSLDKAEHFIKNLDFKFVLEQDLLHLRSLLDAWKLYKNNAVNISFPNWCEIQNLNFEFGKTYYYQ